jgi:hypothetical protein
VLWILILPRAALVNDVGTAWPNDVALLWCEFIRVEGATPPGTASFLPPLSPPLRIALFPFFL